MTNDLFFVQFESMIIYNYSIDSLAMNPSSKKVLLIFTILLSSASLKDNCPECITVINTPGQDDDLVGFYRKTYSSQYKYQFYHIML